jgi:hypothetical protein
VGVVRQHNRTRAKGGVRRVLGFGRGMDGLKILSSTMYLLVQSTSPSM